MRRGGYIAGEDGVRLWITFKYERLPAFYFVSGKLGHDNRHCNSNPGGQSNDCQYGQRKGIIRKIQFKHWVRKQCGRDELEPRK